MKITTNQGITFTCATEQDVRDVCAVMTTEPWEAAEIAEYETLIAHGVPMAEAMRLVDMTRNRKAS